ncbi:tyrosine 3-monooxygenase [Nephila pilipes]|uniref:Tyrosine 3-monooxygenase n=1 Tax=Nephila pilipes TaxID=299642 RepID=A0A8X6PBA2_NEPPI|nr:tyrosine 3-monooxygenase [Nephila pilipes]
MDSGEESSKSKKNNMEKIDILDENDFAPRRRSLVSCAKFETLRNKVVQSLWITELKKEETKNFTLSEEEVLILSLFPKENPNVETVINLVFSVTNGLLSLPFILKCIEKQNGRIEHVETRPSKRMQFSFDILLKVFISKNNLLDIIKSIRSIDDIVLHGIPGKGSFLGGIWFPKHISDLDQCTHVLSKFEPDLDNSHPGFNDISYRARRKEIADIAFRYKYGQAIPTVKYTEEETKTWGIVFKKMSTLHSKYACSSYRTVFRLLEEECIFSPSFIPQMQDISIFLKKKTGFTLRPAAGLVSARDFLASLAFRVFQCTQYVRHSCSPDHSPEPDCIHEFLGHVPMLADPSFARFSQEIGIASLGAADAEIEKLSTIYWFTVEFGLCKENNDVKAYGAGLLSSYGELQHALSEKPKLIPFEPDITAIQPYQDLTYQDVYFVAESFDEAKDQIINYVEQHINRKFEVIYDPFTESVVELESLQLLENRVEAMKSELSTLSNALSHLDRSKKLENKCL